MDAQRYTVTIHAAAPGTPIRGDSGLGEVDISAMQRSVPGHVFYSTYDGNVRRSWGFAPIEHGEIVGAGKPFEDDIDQYVDPFYERTMEISREQYDKLNDFGGEPASFGFDLTYKDVRNNCVDFTWAALNHAGIQRTERTFGSEKAHGVDGKLNFLPSHAPADIRTIADPMPGSDLNGEVNRPLPEMKWWQIPLSEAERVPTAELDDPFDRLYAATVANDDQAFEQVAQDYLKSADGQAFLASGREFNQQQEQAQAQAEQAQAQAQAPAAPAMQMSM